MNHQQKELLNQLAQLGLVNYVSNTKENIVKAISEMDIDALGILLDDETTYQDTSKSLFIKKVDECFSNFREIDKYLIPHEGKCISTDCINKNKKGFTFVGNHSGCSMNLIFEQEENGFVKDIFTCHNFCSDVKRDGDFKETFAVSVYDDEKITFKPSSNYTYHNGKAIEALDELKSYEGQILSVENIQDWVKKYKNVYEGLQWDSRYKNISEFSTVFFHVKELCNYILLEKQAVTAIENFYQLGKDELSLLKWLVKYEDLYLDVILVDKGLISEEGVASGKAKISKRLECYFNPSILKCSFQINKIFDEIYYGKLKKYNVFTLEKQKKIPLGEKYRKYNSLKYHLEKRGIICEDIQNIVDYDLILRELEAILLLKQKGLPYYVKPYTEIYKKCKYFHSLLCDKCVESKSLNLPYDCICKPSYCVKNNLDFKVYTLYETIVNSQIKVESSDLDNYERYVFDDEDFETEVTEINEEDMDFDKENFNDDDVPF